MSDFDPAEQSSGNRFRINQTLAIQIVTWLIAALLTYGAINARVAVLESRTDALKADIAEIKMDVKALLRQVR